MSSVLSDKHFHDEAAATRGSRRGFGRTARSAALRRRRAHQQAGRQEHPDRPYKCYQCRKPFTVKVGTIFEASHMPLHLWLQAIHLMAASKKGISSNQLHRILGVTLKSAWFMSHRIREAMRRAASTRWAAPARSSRRTRPTSAARELHAVVAARRPALHQGGRSGPRTSAPCSRLVERGGKARTFHVDRATKAGRRPDRDRQRRSREPTCIPTKPALRRCRPAFAEHHTVKHRSASTFAGPSTPTPSRACSRLQARHARRLPALRREAPAPLPCRVRFPVQCPRALGVNDAQRAELALHGVVGKRLTYRTTY